MAEILPFKGIRFNPKIVQNLDFVLCPPYDLITPEKRRLYRQKSPYNIVRLESPDSCSEAASTLESWLEKEVLSIEDKKAFYLHEHSFNFRGKKYSRLGLIAIVKADESHILPHEDTSQNQVAERLNILCSCKANFSPIFALYSDRENKIVPILSSYATSNKPIIEIEGGEPHKLWRVDEADTISFLIRLFLPQTIYIADGHHRFKAALIYQKENKEISYVLMSLIEANSPGIIILPVHRLLFGISKETWDKFKQDISPLFKIKAFSSLNLLKQAVEMNQDSIGIYFNGEAYLLTQGGADFPSTLHLLHKFLIPHLTYSSISYISELDEIHLRHDSLLFLLSPLTTAEIIKLSLAKIALPAKSTYFHPKIPAGLVFYKWG